MRLKCEEHREFLVRFLEAGSEYVRVPANDWWLADEILQEIKNAEIGESEAESDGKD